MQLFHANVPKIVFGPGRLEEVGGMMEEIGKKVFLAVDPFLVTTGLNERISRILAAEGIEVEEFSRIEPNPDCVKVDEAAEAASKTNCDCIVAVGGGSAIDFGKAVAVVAGNGGNSWEYTRRKDHTPKVPGPKTLPLVAIPTTAGTGSETTHFSVLSNTKLREKSTIAHERIFPKIALVDPELTYSMPRGLTALTGTDVLAHAIEALINMNASPFARMVALEAIRLTAEYLPRAAANGRNTEARDQMAWASTLAGIAIAHSNPTLPHALGQAAGGYCHSAHGASVAACLVRILEMSYTADLERFAALAEALDPAAAELPLYERAEASVLLVERLLSDIGVTVTFGELGLKEEDIDKVAQIALTGYFTGISLHPRQVDEEEIRQIYRDCL